MLIKRSLSRWEDAVPVIWNKWHSHQLSHVNNFITWSFYEDQKNAAYVLLTPVLLLLCVVLCYLDEQMHFAICFVQRYSPSVEGNKCVHAEITGLLTCSSANKRLLWTDIKPSVKVISVCQTEIWEINQMRGRMTASCLVLGGFRRVQTAKILLKGD